MMKDLGKHLILYAVTDRSWLGENTLALQVEQALRGGATCVQLREKNISDDNFLKEALLIRDICKSYNALFFVNDNVEVAIKSNADGIHVGQSDMNALNVRGIIQSNMILGVSVQTVSQAIEAVSSGADYLGVGAIFATSTKTDADIVGINMLKDICSSVDVPVVAIGGINKCNMQSLLGSGISGIALVSAIFASKNIESECKDLLILSGQIIK